MNLDFSRIKDYILEIIKIVVISAAIIIPVRIFLIHPFIVKGISMEETFVNNDYLIVNRFTYRFNKPNRGDVIVFKSPVTLKDHLIKRVIGLPGETVEIRDGYIFIKNDTYPEGKILDESKYLEVNTLTSPKGVFQIEDGHYFVMGDNRGSSMDSRLFEPIHEKMIVGQAWVRGWPFDRAGAVEEINYPHGL